ncbi:uncharacterized protein LOC116841608 [Odontomachus brunneus]|uniref:uncharacterized protein LOC116841608 n=1 Tax=Odontomachus brunneus TaxID=486640 RepID=UPI0013F28A63|nr:uncharacterized protein LOC116841608 [Odontomachus brunneus]
MEAEELYDGLYENLCAKLFGESTSEKCAYLHTEKYYFTAEKSNRSVCFLSFRINYHLKRSAHRTKEDFIEAGRSFPTTAFQQQIRDFKPKVISSDGRGVTLWKRGDRVSLHCPQH